MRIKIVQKDIGPQRVATVAAAGLVLLAVLTEAFVADTSWTMAALLLACACAAAAFWMSRSDVRTAPEDDRASALASESQARALSDLAPFIEALPEAALLVGRDGRVAGSNAAARAQLQFEASGLRLSAILRHPEVLDAVEAAANEGATRSVDYDTTSSVEEHFRVYVAPIAWGEETAALLIFHDQTAQILTERMRADFIANASHELKTPVTSLSLMMETLTGPAREDAAARERFIGLMAREIDRMRRLIDDLLSLSKVELNEHVPPSERCDLAAIVRDVCETLSPAARESGVSLGTNVTGAVMPVPGDRYQLAQVVQNLIDNAIKYTPRGGSVLIEVGAGSNREEAVDLAGRRWDDAARVALLTPTHKSGAAYAFLRVADTGPGVARRHLPRLSERFFRVEPTEGQPKGGTGLGLAIVRHIVNRHRGGFVVESMLGRGSAFAIYIPRGAAAAGMSEAAE